MVGDAVTTEEAAEAQAERVALTYRSPQDHIPRPSIFIAYFCAMKVTARDAKKSHNLDLKKLGVQQGFKALNAAGFTEVDTSLAGDKQELRQVLPFSKDTLPHAAIEVDKCVELMGQLSALFVDLSQTILAARWFRGAWWSE